MPVAKKSRKSTAKTRPRAKSEAAPPAGRYTGYPSPSWAVQNKVVRVKSGVRVQMESFAYAKVGALGVVETFTKPGRWFWQVSFYGPESWGHYILAEKDDFAKFTPVADNNQGALELCARAEKARTEDAVRRAERDARMRELVREDK